MLFISRAVEARHRMGIIWRQNQALRPDLAGILGTAHGKRDGTPLAAKRARAVASAPSNSCLADRLVAVQTEDPSTLSSVSCRTTCGATNGEDAVWHLVRAQATRTEICIARIEQLPTGTEQQSSDVWRRREARSVSVQERAVRDIPTSFPGKEIKHLGGVGPEKHGRRGQRTYYSM